MYVLDVNDHGEREVHVFDSWRQGIDWMVVYKLDGLDPFTLRDTEGWEFCNKKYFGFTYHTVVYDYHRAADKTMWEPEEEEEESEEEEEESEEEDEEEEYATPDSTEGEADSSSSDEEEKESAVRFWSGVMGWKVDSSSSSSEEEEV